MRPLPDSPFVGLRPFHSDESLLFFGRLQQTIELLERLHGTRFLSVVGSSGSGKSSLVHAGLIPKLEAGFLVEDRDKWITITTTPGDAPIGNLATAVLRRRSASADPTEPARLLDEIHSSGAQAILKELAPALDESDTNCLLLVDQFEELFRYGLRTGQAERRDEATDFVSILLALAERRTAPVYVVMTMRSDFLGDCDAFYGLPEAMNRSQYLVPRLTRAQRREAMEGPVRLYGQAITPQLLDRVLNDTGQESDQLPIMQHALLRTWENWRLNGDGPVDLSHYQAIGTMKEALAWDADAALSELTKEDLKLTRQLFQALTDTDAANRRIRRPARLSELEATTGAARERLWEVIDRFRGHGRSFLVVSEDKGHGDALIDICHESLIRQWKQLRDWVDEEAESRRVYLDIVDAVIRHKGLWHDPDLQVALEWQAKTHPNAAWAARYHTDFARAMGFLEASREQRDRETQEKQKQLGLVRRMTTALFALSFLVLVGISFLFFWARRLQEKARYDSQVAVTKRNEAENSLATVMARAAERAQVDKVLLEEAEHQKQIAIDALNKFKAEHERADAQTQLAEGNGQLAALAIKELGIVAGVDVSHFTGLLDWRTFKQAGILFAFAKASSGLRLDPTFQTNWEEMRKAGIIRGAYHFFDSKDDPVAQAELFLATVKLEPGDLPPVIDLEPQPGVTDDPNALLSGVTKWLEVVEKATGEKAIIATYRSFWRSLGDPQAFANHALWVFQYSDSEPVLFGGWTRWTFWQLSNKARVAGTGRPLDLNRYNGSLDELKALARGANR